MEQIIVTHKNGTTLKLQSHEYVRNITTAQQKIDLLGEDVIDIAVESKTKMEFFIGDKITVIGRDYTLNTPAKELKKSEGHFVYNLHFEGVQYDLLRATYNVNINTTSNEIQDISGDALTGDIKMFLDVLISNANRVFPGKWVLGTYPSGTETKTMTFAENDTCLTVLQSLCAEDNYNTEYRIAIDESGIRTINVGATGTIFGYTFQYGKGKGLYELSREKQSSANIVTRLNVYGSTKNIATSKYRSDRLCLPGKSKAQSFIENADAISAYGVWEGTKNFENVYPDRVGTVSALGGSVLQFVDSTMDFDLNAKDEELNTIYLISGTTAKIHFNTGNLAGYEFELSAYDHATKTFTLISQTDENGYTFPSPTSAAFQFAAGDKYVITDVFPPQTYIDSAEANLATKGAEYLATYSQPQVQYALTVDPNFLKEIVGEGVQSNIIMPGDYLPVYDADLNVDKTLRVKSITRDLLKDYAYTITISDMPVTVSNITRVMGELREIDNVIRINNLRDVAKARRNYLAAQEVLNIVFDPDGYFTDKIRPLSVETSMLAVGAKSMQFGMAGTMFQVNYAGAKNRIVYAGGTLAHYAILDSEDNPRVWTVADGDVTLESDGAYYIYAKCSRSTSSASILFSQTKILPESDGAYYHFLIGVVNSVQANNERAIALMYGFTTVNGRFIKTGRIQSADGNTYFDLDTSEIGGKIYFKDGLVSGLIGVGPDAANINAGMSGTGTADTDIRFWAGSTPANKATAPYRVLHNGKGYMTDAEISGKIVATSGKIGNWEISGGGIVNEDDTAYIIARNDGVSGEASSMIGSNVISAAAGITIPAWIQNTVENYDENIALLLTAKHGIDNYAIRATGDIVMTVGDAISSRINYIDLFDGSGNIILINKGLKVHSRNISRSTQSLWLPSLSEMRDTLWIYPFSVTSAMSISSTTTKTYYVEKGNGLFVGDCIKYGASAYKTITAIVRSGSSTMDTITVDETLGVTVANGGEFTAIHEFAVEICIFQDGSVTQTGVNVVPNGASWFNNDGALLTSVAMGRGDILKVFAYTRKNTMYYQLGHYKT